MTPEALTPKDVHEWVSFEDPDEDRTWSFDLTFLLSRWSCIFGRGCKGVLTEEAPELEHGCCSYGAHFSDAEDRARIEAAVATLRPDQWQYASIGRKKGVVVDEATGSGRTRLHQGACILLNRPGFPRGIGCALHSAALERGQHPVELKPDVCWQLPLRRVDSTDENGHVTSTLREWKRRDWGGGGLEFAWWCTEAPDAFGADPGEHTVLGSMQTEIIAMVGVPAYQLLLAAMAERARSAASLPHPASLPRPAVKRRIPLIEAP